MQKIFWYSLLVTVLISSSALSHAASERYHTPSEIEKAVDAGDIAEIERLCSAGANINQRNRDGLPLLFHALWKSAPNSMRVVDFLLRQGVSVACIHRGENPMQYVLNRIYAFQAKKERVQALMNAGAYADSAMVRKAMHQDQDTRLWIAVYGAHRDGIRGLSDKEWQELKQVITNELEEGVRWRAQLPEIAGIFFPGDLCPLIGEYAHPYFSCERAEDLDNMHVARGHVADAQQEEPPRKKLKVGGEREAQEQKKEDGYDQDGQESKMQ
jgi:hypothetical protein